MLGAKRIDLLGTSVGLFLKGTTQLIVSKSSLIVRSKKVLIEFLSFFELPKLNYYVTKISDLKMREKHDKIILFCDSKIKNSLHIKILS